MRRKVKLVKIDFSESRCVATDARRWVVLLFFVGQFLVLGCATNQGKRWTATGAAVVAGVGIGTAAAPAGERKELHAVFWGSLLGLGAALIAQEVYSDQKEIDRLNSENEKQRLQLDIIQNANTVLLREGKGYFKSQSGEELFSSGKAKWRLYQIDKWVKNGPNQLIHQDKMVEIVPLEDSGK